MAERSYVFTCILEASEGSELISVNIGLFRLTGRNHVVSISFSAL